MTKKESLLRAIRHQKPAWVPNGMESVVTMNDEIERYGSAFYRREVASV